MANQKPLSEQLRRFVVESGLTRYQIAKLTGLPESTLSRFVVGGLTPRMATADKLAEVLGLELRKTRRKVRR
jgi:transcriptional regulator with XRE-family HTH domain